MTHADIAAARCRLAAWDQEQRALGHDPEIIGAQQAKPVCCPCCGEQIPWRSILGLSPARLVPLSSPETWKPIRSPFAQHARHELNPPMPILPIRPVAAPALRARRPRNLPVAIVPVKSAAASAPRWASV